MTNEPSTAFTVKGVAILMGEQPEELRRGDQPTPRHYHICGERPLGRPSPRKSGHFCPPQCNGGPV